MADSSNRRHAVYGLALIGLAVVVHYGWAFVPAEHQAQAWNAFGAFGRLCLLVAVVWRFRSLIVLLAALWWAAEELMVMGCSVAYIVSPWEVLPGEAQCSALLQFDLGRIGALALAVLLVASVRYYRGAK